MIIDAWIQHPTEALIATPMFETLRRWLRVEDGPLDIPLEMTLGALDAGGISQALTTA